MKNQSKIALGTWSWGAGFAGGDQVFGNNLGVDELRPVFDEAMANGVNLWDSAVVYGMGTSETLLSTFTKNRKREDIFISTKFTPQIAGESEDPVADMLAGSLERFATGYVDIYWIHNPADVERWTPYLIPLVKSGKVKESVFPTITSRRSNVWRKFSRKKGYISLPFRTITACSTSRQKRQAFWITAGRTASTFGLTWCWNRGR